MKCAVLYQSNTGNTEKIAEAIFATCGFYPVEKYKDSIEKTMQAWINEDVEYLGMYLCQGRVQHSQQVRFINETSNVKDAIHEMFTKGESHPDEEDIREAKEFVKSI